MSRKTTFSETDSKLIQLIDSKDLSESRIRAYDVVFDEIYELYGYTPSKLLDIAKKEQKPFLNDNGLVDVIELDDRLISNIQTSYNNHLKNKKINGKPLENRTREGKLRVYRAFLNKFHIELPDMVEITIKKERLKDKDIPTWKDVEKAMSLCKSIRDKTIIAFAVSTGFRVSDIVNFTIEDLIEACSIYFTEDEEHTLDNLLKKNPDKIVPCWEMNPQKTTNHHNLTITFNTPETSNYMWDYLKDRIRLDTKKNPEYKITYDEPLFKSQRGGKLATDTIQDHFRKLNVRLGNERDKNPTFGKFRLQNLRKLFKTTCRRALDEVQVKSDKTFNGDIINLFAGHTNKNNPMEEFYEALEDDSPESHVRKVYEAIMPYLSIQPIEVKDFKTEAYEEMENKYNNVQKQFKVTKVKMQREMDEQKADYEKQIASLQAINKSLTQQVETIESRLDDMARANDMEKIQEYIKSNKIVNDYNLSEDVYNTYQEDIDNGKEPFIDNNYMETLVARAYNNKIINGDIASGLEIETEIYNDELYKNIKNAIDKEYDNIMEANIILSTSQSNKINETLKKYAEDIWLKKGEVDTEKVRNMILDIIKNG